jgi:hypothetical protein
LLRKTCWKSVGRARDLHSGVNRELFTPDECRRAIWALFKGHKKISVVGVEAKQKRKG